MKTAQLIRIGESQAVRLPTECRFEGQEVFIKRSGDAVVLLPKPSSWASLAESLEKFPADLMAGRDQPGIVDVRANSP